MKLKLLLAGLLLSSASSAFASGPWFPVVMVKGEVSLGAGDGMSIDDCVKVQLEFEKHIKEYDGVVRCSNTSHRVRAEDPDGTLVRAYRFQWVGDQVVFTEVSSYEQCEKQRKLIAKHGGEFFCGRSYQLIK